METSNCKTQASMKIQTELYKTKMLICRRPRTLARARCGSAASNLLRGIQASAEEVHQRFYGEFHKQERLGDEIVAAAHGRIGAAFEVVEAGNKDNRSLFVRSQAAEFGAKFE